MTIQITYDVDILSQTCHLSASLEKKLNQNLWIFNASFSDTLSDYSALLIIK